MEKTKRKLKAKKGAIKRKTKAAKIRKKMKKALKKRKTFGEMKPSQKYKMDHRYQAFKKIKKFL